LLVGLALDPWLYLFSVHQILESYIVLHFMYNHF
jgi:hypothetical protein